MQNHKTSYSISERKSKNITEMTASMDEEAP